MNTIKIIVKYNFINLEIEEFIEHSNIHQNKNFKNLFEKKNIPLD